MAGSYWSSWLDKVKNIALPESYISETFRNPEDRARASMDYLLEKTGANKDLSPFMSQYLRGKSLLPLYQRHLLGSNAYGGTPPYALHTDYLRDWLKKYTTEGGPDLNVTRQLRNVSGVWQEDPATATKRLQEGVMYGGPFGDYYTNKLGELYNTYMARPERNVNDRDDYYRFMRERLAGLF